MIKPSCSIKSLHFSQTWDIRHRVMWPNKELSYVKLEEDPAGSHYGLFVEDALVSVVSAFVKGREMQFRKFATEVEFQARGYGSILLTFLLEEAEKKDVKRIWCNARKEKAYFYRRFGMRETEVEFVKGGIEYVIMEIRR